MFGPGLITFPTFAKYRRIELDTIAPKLIHVKYEYKIKIRINE
jgi:hypothetical protein